MTDTIPTTPFPAISYDFKSRLTHYGDYGTCTRGSFGSGGQLVKYADFTGYGKTTAVDPVAGYGTCLRIAATPASSTSTSPAYFHGCVALPGTHVRSYSGGRVPEAAPAPAPKTVTYDPDLTPWVRCETLARARREVFSVHARVVSVLVQWLRAREADEISRPLCLREFDYDVVVTHPDKDHCVLVQAKHAAGNGPEPAEEYPLSSFYRPAEYDWSTEGYEAREALKRFSELTHADR
jgi:hypothetical protein